jgi:hypothetical protein
MSAIQTSTSTDSKNSSPIRRACTSASQAQASRKRPIQSLSATGQRPQPGTPRRSITTASTTQKPTYRQPQRAPRHGQPAGNPESGQPRPKARPPSDTALAERQPFSRAHSQPAATIISKANRAKGSIGVIKQRGQQDRQQQQRGDDALLKHAAAPVLPPRHFVRPSAQSGAGGLRNRSRPCPARLHQIRARDSR